MDIRPFLYKHIKTRNFITKIEKIYTIILNMYNYILNRINHYYKFIRGWHLGYLGQVVNLIIKNQWFESQSGRTRK